MSQADMADCNILVVDDDAVQRSLLEAHVRAAGHESLLAAGPAEALSLLRDGQRNIAVVISDVRMPDQQAGLDFIRELHAGWPDVPLLVVCGAVEDLDELRGHAEYPALLIPKPVQAFQIQDALALILRPRQEAYTAMATGLLLYDGGGQLLSMNPAAQRTLGRNAEKMASADAAATFIREDGTLLPKDEWCVARVLATKKAVPDMIVGVTLPDAQRRWVHCNAVPTFGRHGDIEQIVATVTDITGPRNAQRALRRGYEQFRVMVESAHEGIVHFDKEGRITYVNQRMCEMNGHTAEEQIGHTLAEFASKNAQRNYNESQARRQSGRPMQRQVPIERPDGTMVWAMLAESSLFDEQGEFAGSVCIFTDLSEVKAAERALATQALHDGLTGLPNRILLQDRLEHAITVARREGTQLSFMMMDLDGFKEVNDTFGHHAGDLLLREVGSRMQSLLRESDTFGRLGGDEFGVVLPGPSDPVSVGTKLLRALDEPFVIEDQSLVVGASIGVATFPDHGTDSSSLLRQADVAMYVAKREHLGFSVYAVEQDEHSSDRLSLVADLRRAIDTGQLELHYQPKVDIRTRRMAGSEALLRWRHPQRGLLAPDNFLPLAEKNGLMRQISRWVLQSAAGQLRLWQRQGRDVPTSVNLTMRDLRNPNLPDEIRDLLATCQVEARLLRVEITENAIMADPRQTMDVVKRLHQLGVPFCIDDFGTGYSSLAYLKRFPAEEIKIDKSFVVDVTRDDDAAMIVRSVIDLAHNLGRITVAEGIESQEVWDRLAQLGCDQGQGYWMGEPMPAQAFERWMAESPFGVH